ncbi:kel-10 [Symbiodinium microadriaticum]|nr:kel-10 [Symbiodinium microadriaticum]
MPGPGGMMLAGTNGDLHKGNGRHQEIADGMDDDTLGKARKAAKVHLYALRDHVEQAMEAFERLESVVFLAAETVKADRRALMEDRIAAASERHKAEAELATKQDQIRREQEAETRKLRIGTVVARGVNVGCMGSRSAESDRVVKPALPLAGADNLWSVELRMGMRGSEEWAQAMPKGYGQYPQYPDPFPGKGFSVPAGPWPNKGYSKGGPTAPGFPGVPGPVYEGYQYQFSVQSMGPMGPMAGPVPGPGRPAAGPGGPGPGPVAATQKAEAGNTLRSDWPPSRKVPPAAARTRKSMGPLMPPLPPSALRPDSPVLPEAEADDCLWPTPQRSTSRSQVTDVPPAAPAQPQAAAPRLGTQPDRKSESPPEAPSSETHSSASVAPVMPVTEDSMPRMPAMPAAMPEPVAAPPTQAVGMQAPMSDQGLPKEAPASTRPDMPEPHSESVPAAQAGGGKPAPLVAMPEPGLGAAAAGQGQAMSVAAVPEAQGAGSFSEPGLSPSGALPAAELGRSSSRGGPSVQFAEGCEDPQRAVPTASRSGSRPTVTHLRSELERLQKEMEALRLQPTATSSPDTAMREEELRLLREQPQYPSDVSDHWETFVGTSSARSCSQEAWPKESQKDHGLDGAPQNQLAGLARRRALAFGSSVLSQRDLTRRVWSNKGTICMLQFYRLSMIWRGGRRDKKLRLSVIIIFRCKIQATATLKHRITEQMDVETPGKLGHQVIVFGGFDGSADHRSTEILDTASMTFSMGPTMGVGRSGCAVASLDERRVLVAGGFDGSRSLDTTELVDPVTLKVSAGPRMGTRRNACAAVRLDAKRLLVIGGSDDASELDSTEVLDLEKMTFSSGPRMGTCRNACAASLIDSQRLLVIGGSDGGSDLDSTELLDLGSMTFSAGPRMSTRRNFCATALLQPGTSTAPRGLLLVLGGSDGSSSLDSTEVLDVSKMSFQPGPNMGTWRSGCAAATLSSEQLLVVGGFDGSNHLDSTEVLDVKHMSFTLGPRLSTWRSGCASAPC